MQGPTIRKPGSHRRSQTLSLHRLRLGEHATVVAVDTRGAVGQRLFDLGIAAGKQLTVERVAPLGDPLWVNVDGLRVLLRDVEAQQVTICRLENQDG